jgi:hypothetical protein
MQHAERRRLPAVAERPDSAGPDSVSPVQIAGIRYEALHWGRARGFRQDGGLVRAFDVVSGADLWVTQVYEGGDGPFIARIAQAGGGLLVTDEWGRQFLLDLQTRRAMKLAGRNTARL